MRFTDPATGRQYEQLPDGSTRWVIGPPTRKRHTVRAIVLGAIATVSVISIISSINSLSSRSGDDGLGKATPTASGKPTTAPAPDTATSPAAAPAPDTPTSPAAASATGPTATSPPASPSSVSPTPPQGQEGTLSQRNALRSAESYLAISGFSRQGLIDQLASSVGGGFSTADATWAVDHLTGVDWNAQAVRSAETYLKISGFSRARLIEQLSSPVGGKYTKAQATYAADKLGL